MAKQFKLGIKKRIFASYILVLVVAMIICGILVSSYVKYFLQEKIVEFNSKSTATVIHELDSLYQRIEQFSSIVYDQDIYTVISERRSTHNFTSIKRQIEFESHIKNSLLINGLHGDVVGITMYIDDDNYYYVGDGVLSPSVKFSTLGWYGDFVANNSSKQMSVIGPLAEDYRPAKSTSETVVLFINKLHVPQNIQTEKTPFVMLSVRFNSVKEYLDIFFNNTGAYVSNDNSGAVYTANLDEEKTKDFLEMKEQGLLDTSSDGACVYNNNNLLVTGTYVAKYGWTIYSISPTEDIFEEASGVVFLITLIFVGCSILGILMAWTVSKSVMVPIQTMNSMISRMEQGEETFIKVSTNDEVGQIGQRFNSMKLRLQEMTSKIHLSEIKQKQAQLHALQSQINPHFLYNTLENIYCMAQIHGAEDVAVLTENLSDMMRYSIDTNDTMSNLQHELKHVRDYISIINLRHDNAVNYVETVDVSLYEIKTMKLLLQPLVENAWTHGLLKTNAQKGTISVSAEVVNGKLVVEVADNGAGMDAQQIAFLEKNFEEIKLDSGGEKPTSGLGIGLQNVNDRIRLAYGDDYGLKIESAPLKGSKISIWVKC